MSEHRNVVGASMWLPEAESPRRWLNTVAKAVEYNVDKLTFGPTQWSELVGEMKRHMPYPSQELGDAAIASAMRDGYAVIYGVECSRRESDEYV